MVERTPILDFLTYFFLILGVVIVGFPVLYTIIAATLPLEEVSKVPMPFMFGDQLFVNIKAAWTRGNLGTQITNSFIMATGITVGKITVSLLGAFSIVYFDYKMRIVAFVSVFCTLMLPVEVRILPTYEMAAVNFLEPVNYLANLFSNVELDLEWNLLDSYTGLILPLVASATCTFLFRQFFLTVPEELCEAAKMDGASPMTFLRKILIPLSKTNIAALVVIEFVYGYNQYLWPLLITTNPKMTTAIIGLQNLIPQADDIPEWNIALAAAILVMLPPILVVLFMQRWFIKGLVDAEK